MTRKSPAMQGFARLSDQVFVRDGAAPTGADTTLNPDIVVIYGWGDCLPQHVAKYSDGFRAVYPRATQVVVLSPIAKALFTNRAQRRGHMTPVVDYLFGAPDDDAHGVARKDSTMLVHAMSNTGAVNFAATLDAYTERFRQPMPHTLFVMDSTPGATDLSWDNLKRWSRAMALGTAKWFPWPFVATQSLWGVLFLLHTLYLWLRRRQHAGAWSRVAARDEAFATRNARRLYMYSKDDDLIGYKDIEEHAEEAKKLGYAVDVKEFFGSGHVGHMRLHSDEYWKAIQQSWGRTIKPTGER